MKKALSVLTGTILLSSVWGQALAVADADKPDRSAVRSVEFVASKAPETVQDRAVPFTTATVKVTYANGGTRTFPLSYKTLLKSTDVINGTPAGLAVDVNGKPIMDNSIPGNPTPFVSDDPDANSLMKIDGAAPTGKGGNPLSLVTHFEYITADNAGNPAWGMVPASMSLTSLNQDKKTGELSVVDLKKIAFDGVDGLWIPCNGSLSPWNTHLGSEEYEPDARDFYSAKPMDQRTVSFANYYFHDATKANPYLYGYVPEVTVHANGTTDVSKHYSIGRLSHELVKVMPDQRTVFMGDDGGNTMLFMYIADKAGDLSAGSLYAAKWLQTSDVNGGAANLKWIKLGHATDAEVKALAGKTKFADIFETADKDTAGFTKIRTYPSGKDEWLKVKPGMEKAAAFLEARRFGAIQGATAEFNKMEGVTLNAKDKKVYVAISYQEKAMLADPAAPADDIKLKKLSAGATYELPLTGGQKDQAGEAIDSSYVAFSMSALVLGQDLSKPDAVGNTANVDLPANPDNLSYSEAMRTLFIGEDSGMHVNNFVWAYNVDTKKLSRILSVPAGAEATGLTARDNLNGFNYITSNVQHPGDFADLKTMPDGLKKSLSPLIDAKSGYIGYISGLPQLVGAPKGEKVEKETNVPLYKIMPQLGATIVWNQQDRTVTISKDETVWVIKPGSQKVTVNGVSTDMNGAAMIVHDRTMVPAEWLDQLFQADVYFDGQEYMAAN